MVENFIRYDEYFFVKRDRTIVSRKDEKIISYETFIEVIKMAFSLRSVDESTLFSDLKIIGEKIYLERQRKYRSRI